MFRRAISNQTVREGARAIGDRPAGGTIDGSEDRRRLLGARELQPVSNAPFPFLLFDPLFSSCGSLPQCPPDAVDEQKPELGVGEIIGMPERRKEHARAFDTITMRPRDRFWRLIRNGAYQQRGRFGLQGAHLYSDPAPTSAETEMPLRI